jgi:D-glycero-D-manno-heptose 1,7-bisphosphate phosphatase
MRTKAIFLDRDGTLNEMVYDETHGLLDSPRRPEQVALIPGAAAFMREARTLGYKLVVVTNQPGIAKGTLPLPELEAVNGRLAELLKQEGAWWDALYFCPHHPKGQPGVASPYVMACDCRKPKPGLLLRAAVEMDIDLHASWMVGDGLNDIQAGNAAGCRTVLLTHLKIEQIERFLSVEGAVPTRIVPNLTRIADNGWGKAERTAND